MNEKFIKIANRFLNEASPDSTTDTPEGATDKPEEGNTGKPVQIKISYADLVEDKQNLIVDSIATAINATETDEESKSKIKEKLIGENIYLFETTNKDLATKLNITAAKV